MKFKNFKEYKEWLASVSNEEKESFCPFECGYCDMAYSEACFECQGKDLRFDGE